MITVLIPYYNEKNRVSQVIKVLNGIDLVTQIVAVDDGSTDEGGTSIQHDFPQITHVQLKVNQGKSKAIAVGLQLAKSQDIILIDADYRDVTEPDITSLISYFQKNDLDMLIGEVGGGNNRIDRWTRKEVLFSGLRLLKKSDLLCILETDPKGYELELFINEYMYTHHKKVAWMKTSIRNIHKVFKWGL